MPKKSRRKIRSILLKHITQYHDRKEFKPVLIETAGSIHRTYSEYMLDSYVRIKFKDDEFLCFENWAEYLKCAFGDYMQLPPESERTWKHHSIISYFEQNYEEL